MYLFKYCLWYFIAYLDIIIIIIIIITIIEEYESLNGKISVVIRNKSLL